MPNLLWFSPVPVLVVFAMLQLWRALHSDVHAAPFLWTLALVFLGYSGLGISLWPHVLPPNVTIWDAAGPPQSLGFALVGALLIIPVILMYTAFSYWVFRGKVQAGEGYH
jgi:cytochrome d ubiquinol oxidase subunit II